jgi:2-oxoglutarate dehydrogenase E1 component
VLGDRDAQQPRRILLCTGKIGHDLRAERTRRHDMSVAIVSLEQLYPFPSSEVSEELHRHPTARDIVWVQEEPANMGARTFVVPRLRRIGGSRPVRSVRRSASASPATGSSKAHEIEQKTLLDIAFG